MGAEFYIFSTDSHYNENIYNEKAEAIQNNRKRRVICIPKNEETIRCLRYYEPRMINCVKEVIIIKKHIREKIFEHTKYTL